VGKLKRRTLKFIQYYPSPRELYQKIVSAPGWNYKENAEFYHARDRALASLTYLLGGRISEILRLKKSQFIVERDRVVVRGIQLSKSRYKDRPRREQFREEAWLPLRGERSGLTELVLSYLRLLGDNDLLFPFSKRGNIFGGSTVGSLIFGGSRVSRRRGSKKSWLKGNVAEVIFK
jgi:integrase